MLVNEQTSDIKQITFSEYKNSGSKNKQKDNPFFLFLV